MSATTWNWNTSFDEVCRRASARREYNALRRLRAKLRRAQMVRCVEELGEDAYFHGIKAHLAEKFGVHRSTITRDFERLAEEGWAARPRRCPLCATIVPAERLDIEKFLADDPEDDAIEGDDLVA